MIHLLHHKVLLVYQVFDKNIGVKENIQDQEIEETKEKKIIKEVIDKDTEEDIVVLEVELLLIKEGEIINDIAAKELNTIQIENTHNGIGMKKNIMIKNWKNHLRKNYPKEQKNLGAIKNKAPIKSMIYYPKRNYQTTNVKNPKN